MSFVHAKPGDDVMNGYDFSHHKSPDHNYVPGFGERSHQSTASSSVASKPTKRDSLSNLWHLYAKNHSAEPYTEYHKAHNANIFNHVKQHYGVEVAKAMHGHAEALRQGHVYAIRKKYNIMEIEKPKKIPTDVDIIDPEQEAYDKGRIKELERDREEYKRDAENSRKEKSKKKMDEDIENKDKPLSSKALARKLITDFKNKKIRNRKRLKKVSDVYAKQNSIQESSDYGEQKFSELKEHPYVKSHFIGDWYKANYGDHHHAFQTKEHTSLKNGSKHELRAAVRPNGDHEVTLLSHHKTKNEFASGRGVGKSWDEAINKARAEHSKSLDLAAGGIKAHPRAHVKVRKEMDDLEH